MRVPENKIEEIRNAANIVDVVSEFVQLRKRGRNFLGLCPFHNEKTPSFTVSEDKQIYHCFGCHSGGNVFKFLMEYEKISFIESVQEVAQRYGITLEFDEEAVNEKQSEQEVLYDINTEAGKYFSSCLLNHSQGEIARRYFEGRHIKQQTIRAFGLGYALPDRDSFITFAQQKKIDLEKALALGLIGQNNDGRLYDKFSSRIIFPIFSPNGRVVAFAGRVLDKKESTAKYLNSPESIVYTKGKILYGLSFAKDEIRRLDKAILVEGYMDLISLYQSGIKNVVAVSGTALTEDQVQLLSRYTKNVVLLFDADAAGIKASMRSIELLLRRDMEIKIASLPAGEDPDSYVNNYGRERFEEQIKKAQNFLEYQTEYYEKQGMFNDAAKTTEAIRELVKPIVLINDELKQNLLIKSISKKFNLREKLLENELAKAVASAGKQITSEERARDREEARQNEIQNKSEVKTTSSLVYNLEKEIILLLFEGNEEIIEFIFHHIKPEEFTVEIHRKLAEIVYQALHDGGTLKTSGLIDKITEPDLQNYINGLSVDKYSFSKILDEIHPGMPEEKVILKSTVDMVRKFKMEQINYLISQNLKLMEATESEDERAPLIHANLDLEKEKLIISKELDSNLYV